MKQDGFTLIEISIAMALMIIIGMLATGAFQNSRAKSTIETEFRNLYTDLNAVRSQALYRKKPQSVIFTSTEYDIYSSSNYAANPISRTKFKAPVTVPANLRVDYDSMGFATFSNSSTSVNICALTNNNIANIDSIIMSPTRIQLGQMSSSRCKSAKPL